MEPNAPRAPGSVKPRTGGDEGIAAGDDLEVRDPAEAIGRWTWWESGTDGDSPDERQRASGDRRPRCPAPR
jgi:hypothetical protein